MRSSGKHSTPKRYVLYGALIASGLVGLRLALRVFFSIFGAILVFNLAGLRLARGLCLTCFRPRKCKAGTQDQDSLRAATLIVFPVELCSFLVWTVLVNCSCGGIPLNAMPALYSSQLRHFLCSLCRAATANYASWLIFHSLQGPAEEIYNNLQAMKKGDGA